MFTSLRQSQRTPSVQVQVEQLLKRNFPRFQLLKASQHSDLEYSLSGKTLRLQFLSGRRRCGALFPLGESTEGGEALLGQALIWRDYLQKLKTPPPEVIYLLVPSGREAVLHSRLHWVRGAGHQIQLARIHGSCGGLELLDPADAGNLDTQMTRVNRHSPPPHLLHNEWTQRILLLAPGMIELQSSPLHHQISFRIKGLEFATLKQGKKTVIKFGIPCQRELSSPDDWHELTSLARQIMEERQTGTARRASLLYRLQGERWLESLVLQQIQTIDPDLDPAFVYPQVPMFLGGDRGIIDILSITRNGQLAVLELKIHENIELPFQGLDYWLRVRWHLERGEFMQKGYFAGRELASLPPRLYFICPQFDYHDTFPLLTQQITSGVPIHQIGLNEDWRSGLQVVLRRVIHS
jgi:hypothetical protein